MPCALIVDMVDLHGKMRSWKGRMLDLFGAACIRKRQRLPQLGVVVALQREKPPVRARRVPAFRAFERSPHPSTGVWRVPGVFWSRDSGLPRDGQAMAVAIL